MKKIFYGLSGEGLGHASRTLSVIDAMPDVEFHVFTYGKAYDYFLRLGYPCLHRIKGLMFSYKHGNVDYLDLAKRALSFYHRELPLNIHEIQHQARLIEPDLYVTDFEPSVPRAAKGLGGKLVSVDNQHRFAYWDGIRLPLGLRIYGWICGAAAKLMVPNPDHTVISTFHWDKIKVRRPNVTLTNGLLRKSIEEEAPSDDNYVLVYLRDSVADKVLKAIEYLPYKFVVFGAPLASIRVGKMMEEKPNFTFLPLSPVFTKYLAHCTCVISTAGNQLLTEARYYRKPVLAIPEPRQYEQDINAHYASYVNMGRRLTMNGLNAKKVDDFIQYWSKCCYVRYERHIENGVQKVAEVLRSYLC